MYPRCHLNYLIKKITFTVSNRHGLTRRHTSHLLRYTHLFGLRLRSVIRRCAYAGFTLSPAHCAKRSAGYFSSSVPLNYYAKFIPPIFHFVNTFLKKFLILHEICNFSVYSLQFVDDFSHTKTYLSKIKKLFSFYGSCIIISLDKMQNETGGLFHVCL